MFLNVFLMFLMFFKKWLLNIIFDAIVNVITNFMSAHCYFIEIQIDLCILILYPAALLIYFILIILKNIY